MSRNICITNRKLTHRPLSEQVERAIEAGADMVIVREKDLTEMEYADLMRQIVPLCRRKGVPAVYHTFLKTASEQKAQAVHLPLGILLQGRPDIPIVGASCHSPEEAEMAQRLGADYITISHIFATDCKPGLPPRGLSLISEVKERVSIPVYALGGITPDRIRACIEAGADGTAMMSYYMHV